MGTVWLAERADDQFQKSVAIKVIQRGMVSDDLLARFRAERQLLAHLDHPNIAHLLDGGETEEGLPYLVMEFIQGEPIDRFCESQSLDLRARLLLFQQVCGAVQYAHQKLIVHRDLKHGNILVTRDGAPRLLDFGIARLLDRSHGHSAAVSPEPAFFTPECASPEQIRGEAVTTLSDIYSLGVLLHRLLTGRGPYPADTGSITEYRRRICELPVQPPSVHMRGSRPRVSRWLAGELDLIVLKALQKDPRSRYPTAEQFSDDVRRALSCLPISARPDTPGYRIRLFLRRHFAVAALGLSAFALAVALGVVSSVHALRLATQQAALLEAKQEAEENAHRQQEVARFLQDMIASAQPGGDTGEAAGARELLDRAAGRLAFGELVSQPRVEIPLRLTLARAYHDRGDFVPAREQMQRGLSLSLEVLGPQHETTARFLVLRGLLFQREEAFDDADAAFTEALDIANVAAGPESELAGRIWNSIGLLRREQHRDAESEQAMLTALPILRRTLGPENGTVGIALRNLAMTRATLGRYNEALATIQSSVDVLSKAYGADSVAAIYASSCIPRIWAMQERYDNAIDGFHEAIARMERVEGPGSHNVAMMNNRMAGLLHSAGRDNEALAVAQRALQSMRRRYPEAHFVLAAELQQCGEIVMSLGRFEEAEALLDEAASVFEALGERHRARAAAVADALAACRRAMGQSSELEPPK